MIVLTYSAHADRLKRFVAWAVVTGLLGLALCGASLNDGPIPINKGPLIYNVCKFSDIGTLYPTISL